MIQTQISLKEEQHKALKLLAVEENNSMSEQIRKAVDGYLNGHIVGRTTRKK